MALLSTIDSGRPDCLRRSKASRSLSQRPRQGGCRLNDQPIDKYYHAVTYRYQGMIQFGGENPLGRIFGATFRHDPILGCRTTTRQAFSI